MIEISTKTTLPKYLETSTNYFKSPLIIKNHSSSYNESNLHESNVEQRPDWISNEMSAINQYNLYLRVFVKDIYVLVRTF